MAQRLRVCVSLPEDLCSVLSTHMQLPISTGNSSSTESDTFWALKSLHSHAQIHTQTYNGTQKEKQNFNFKKGDVGTIRVADPV